MTLVQAIMVTPYFCSSLFTGLPAYTSSNDPHNDPIKILNFFLKKDHVTTLKTPQYLSISPTVKAKIIF